VYYGLSFNTNDLGGNAYINFVIAGTVEFPAYLLVIFLSSKFGRRSSLMSLTLLAAMACIACAPIAENGIDQF
jgi:OCT family organic cation transporter-like MFS transporter 4/5